MAKTCVNLAQKIFHHHFLKVLVEPFDATFGEIEIFFAFFACLFLGKKKCQEIQLLVKKCLQMNEWENAVYTLSLLAKSLWQANEAAIHKRVNPKHANNVMKQTTNK